MRLSNGYRRHFCLPLVLLASAGAVQAAAKDSGPLEILVLYDNTSAREDIRANWGFAAQITWRGQKLLFDSGAKPDILLANMKALGVDPATIPQAVISHEHGDHINGIYKVFPLNTAMKVHFLDVFPEKAFQAAQEAGMKPVRVTGPVKLGEGIFTTGRVDGTTPEQALAIETAKGLVVVTGCSHPGVVKLVEAAKRQCGDKAVRLLIGGFHMLNQQEAEINQSYERLRELGVESIVATHCTGGLAMKLAAKAWGAKAGTAGAGKRLVLD